jgi:hypothetical protein
VRHMVVCCYLIPHMFRVQSARLGRASCCVGARLVGSPRLVGDAGQACSSWLASTHSRRVCVFVCIHMGVVGVVSGWGGLPGQVGGCVLYGAGSSFEHLVPVL